MSEAPGVRPTDVEGRRIQPVIDQLKTWTHDRVSPLLDTKQIDSKAGIIVARNMGDETETPDGLYHYHAARVLPDDPKFPNNYVNPHFHKIGEEPYVILKGNEGEMNLGKVIDGKVVWDQPRSVREGETVLVQEGQVHSLRNTGKEPLDFVFACPESHLTDNTPEDPTGDRYFTMDLPNGIPPQYPKAA